MFSQPLLRALDDARAGRLAQAIADVRRAAQRHPKDADSLTVLAMLLAEDGQFEQAAHHLARCVQLAPDSPQLRSNYAGALVRLGRVSEAAAQLQRAVAMNPAMAELWMNLSFALLAVPDARGAAEAARRGLALAPGSSAISLNLAVALERLGEPEQGLRIAEEAHRAHPTDVRLHSQYLLMLNAADRPAESIADAHREFGAIHDRPRLPLDVSREPDRALRVGWLSADLRTHSVAYFAEPLLTHAPNWVETVVFSTRHDSGDPVAARLRAQTRQWLAAGHLDDEALVRLIRHHRVDILIETSGHTGDNRLPALTHKPAPVVVTAIGYPNTTGLGVIDYRLVDSITDPAGSEPLATESLMRVDPCFLCYRPPDDAPDPQLPAEGQPVTFGSFNAAHKIGARTIEHWRAALDAVPGSRLLLKSSDLRDAGAGEAVVSRLGAAGIDASRVEFARGTPGVREHLAMYSRVHIALDTFPYNGTTTTCEAMWMGVPVVTLAGERHAGRVGASLLNAAGHPEWVATTPADFARIASDLACNRDRLHELRTKLRAEMRGSLLCDGAAYAGRVYGKLREAWRTYCRTGEGTP